MRHLLKEKMNKRGVSLAEMLITVLIMSVVFIAVTAGGSAAIRVYKSVRKKSDAQTLLSTAIMAMSENLYYSKDIEKDANNVVKSLYSETVKGTISYQNSSTDASNTEPSIYCELISQDTDTSGSTTSSTSTSGTGSSESGSDTATSTPTESSIVTKPTQTLGLYVQLEPFDDGGTQLIKFENGCYHFTVQVKDSSDEDSVVVKQEVYVRSVLYVEPTEQAG